MALESDREYDRNRSLKVKHSLKKKKKVSKKSKERSLIRSQTFQNKLMIKESRFEELLEEVDSDLGSSLQGIRDRRRKDVSYMKAQNAKRVSQGAKKRFININLVT